jgi:ankyrin repeat protein
MKPEWDSALKEGDAFKLAALIAAGADVNALDRFGQSALKLAAQRGHLEAVRVLIARIA